VVFPVAGKAVSHKVREMFGELHLWFSWMLFSFRNTLSSSGSLL